MWFKRQKQDLENLLAEILHILDNKRKNNETGYTMTSTHWLKQRREALQITQEQLAERLSAGGMPLTKAAISKWEVSKAPLPLQTPENRRLIADALELTILELLILDGYEIQDDWSYQTRLVAMLFDSLPPDDQDTVLMMMQHLKDKHTSNHANRSKTQQDVTHSSKTS